MMEKEFVAYEQALALKELGFDEPCVGIYHDNSGGEIKFTFGMFQHPKRNSQANTVSGTFIGEKGCYAPLYQQAFTWFRENHFLYHSIYPIQNWEEKTCWTVTLVNKKAKVYSDYGEPKGFAISKEDTYEEAELACLRKLIEIVKENL